ncbi:Biosynthetic Aromatic amino acid aminotransferase beta [Methylophaga frappieri]|uniref:Histidinol-phosphate aminotransferase n=1 Tax=Methylophaga frappieri (strain ATCC BAA-2434 / DSM 25690 / JAM7) TaxID=754477 RepID=I1YFE8_METFJ|nr:histidinol-phosphate transaminase [Methylophaga frappieri]AFJ01641.1 Biosynthetic Aromatic amino acid aminotransferase beta [Methylophaga frappieri]
MNFHDLANPNLADLQPYVPGKPIAELQRQYGLKQIIKLASNESPLGPSTAVQAAIAMAVQDSTLYPDGNGYLLKQALSERFDLAPDQITLGNGSNDVLELIARCFAGPEDAVMFSEHAFAVYPIATKAIGATAIEVPAQAYGHDLSAMRDAVTDKTKLIFIANPNNPTGTVVSHAALKAFLMALPSQVMVVLDEAYLEYHDNPENTLTWLADFPNLIICRTFSKAYGLAGLRVGYAISHPEVADLLNRLRQPFNVNSLALAAAVAALGDEDYLTRARSVNKAGMQQYEQGLREMGLAFIPSKGNFICVDVGRAAGPVYEGLLKEGIIVRPVAGYGLPNHLRISIGLEQDNAYCLSGLAKVLADD